jgi:hypothetical protein
MTVDYQSDVGARLRAIDWASLGTAYGSATSVPKWLWDLRFGDASIAKEGGHMLWCSLCHQKGQLASAAEFALPFLLEFLPNVQSSLQVEILDILHGFALCSSPRLGYPASGYHASTRRKLLAGVAQLAAFAQHESEDARAFVDETLAELEGSQ